MWSSYILSALLAITGATVIHPERDGAAAVAADQTIVVRGNRIESVGPSASTPIPAGGWRAA